MRVGATVFNRPGLSSSSALGSRLGEPLVVANDAWRGIELAAGRSSGWAHHCTAPRQGLASRRSLIKREFAQLKKRRIATDSGETGPHRRLKTRCSAPSFSRPNVQAPTAEALLPSNRNS